MPGSMYPPINEVDEQFTETWEPPRGLAGWFATVSNSDIGNRYMLTAFIFFLLGGFLALLMRVQLAVSDNTFLGPEVYNRVFTMHGSTMMYLVIIPFLEGLAIYILPAQIGARDMAYPRVSGFSYWIYLFGGIIFYVSFLFGAVPDAGWFAYPPLSGPEFSGLGLDFWLIGLGFIEFGGIAAGVEFAISILKLRAPGMTISRMPLFAWAWLVTAFMIIVAFTTLFTATLLLEMDRGFGMRFFDPDGGGSTLLWQHLFWFFGHPEVYIMFIPATGMVSAIVPVFARRPIVAYKLVAVAIVVTGFLSFGLWVHHMFTTGLPWLSMSFFTAASLMIAIASGVQVFAWIATLWGSRPVLKLPLLFVLGFVFIFVMGGMTGVMVATVPFDWQVHDTYFLVAHFHYVLIGGVIFPILAGVYYWLPKVTGRMLNERLGKWSFWLTFIGFNVSFFPMHIMGFQGMPRRVYTYPASLGLDGLNLLSTAGAFILALGFLCTLAGFIQSLWHGKEAGDDPWGGDTLEWSVPSPPPQANVFWPPIIHSRHPLWEQESLDRGSEAAERAYQALGGQPIGWRATLGTTILRAEPEAIQPVSSPSYAPFFAAFGLLLVSVGEISKIRTLAALGILIGVVAVTIWIWPDDKLLEKLRASRLDEKAGLPVLTTGSRSLGWWAMVSFIATVSVAYADLFYSYFYIRLYSSTWPQDNLPLPDLLLPAVAYGLLAASAAPQFWASRRFREGGIFPASLGLAATFGIGLAFLGLLWLEISRLPFTPQVNAYGSLFYVLSGMFGLTVVTALFMNGLTHVRLYWEGGRRDGYLPLFMEITAMYWYFVVVMGLLVFGVLHLSPYV